MAERTLENRYRVLMASFGDTPRGSHWRDTLGKGGRSIFEALILNFAQDLALSPPDLDQEHVRQLLCDYLPARLGDSPTKCQELPDLVHDFLLFLTAEGGVAKEWEFRNGVDSGRDGFLGAMADPGRPRFAGPKIEPHRRPAKKIGRNDPCPCGSGKKFKKCCARLGS